MKNSLNYQKVPKYPIVFSLQESDGDTENTENSQTNGFMTYLKTLLRSFFLNPTMILLLLAACVRHTGKEAYINREVTI